MKSIKEKAEENLEQNKDEILCVYDRYAGFVDGADYVLDEIENQLDEFHSFEDSLMVRRVVEQLKK